MKTEDELEIEEQEPGREATAQEEAEPPWKIKLRYFKKHRMATIGGTVLIILYLSVIFAGFLAPYSPTKQYKDKFFHRPTKIHLFDQEGLTWPYVYQTEKVGWGEYKPIKEEKYPLQIFYQGDKYKFLNLIPTRLHLFGVEEPAQVFLLGTDTYGRDVFSRLLYGGRVSLFIGFVGIIISSVIGLLVGGAAGYYGGWVDAVAMRAVDVILSIPGFYLLLALAAVLPTDISSIARFFLITVILSFIGWAGMSRVIRGMVMSIRDEDYVVAAQAMGASDLRIIVKHILPTTATYVIVRATLSIPRYILMESGLSFIGLGIQEPDASWGNMLSAAQSVTKMTSFPWLLIPGVFIFVSILCFNLLGDGLRDALDPKSKNS